MTEAEFIALTKGMTDAELVDLQNFLDFLIKCQDEGRTVTDQEVQEMAREARRRIEAHDSP